MCIPVIVTYYDNVHMYFRTRISFRSVIVVLTATALSQPSRLDVTTSTVCLYRQVCITNSEPQTYHTYCSIVVIEKREKKSKRSTSECLCMMYHLCGRSATRCIAVLFHAWTPQLYCSCLILLGTIEKHVYWSRM